MTRKVLIWIVFGGMAVLLIVGFLKKESLNDYISKKMTMRPLEPVKYFTTVALVSIVKTNLHLKSSFLCNYTPINQNIITMATAVAIRKSVP